MLQFNALYTEVEYLKIVGFPETTGIANRTIWQCPLCRAWQLDCPTSLQLFAARDVEEELELHVVACKGKYVSSKSAKAVRKYRSEILYEKLPYIMYADFRSARKKGVQRVSQHKR